MRRGVFLLAILPFAFGACARKSPPPSPAADSTVSAAPSDTEAASQVHAVVDRLPAGAEGMELAKGGLRVMKGYKFVKETDSTFVIARINDGHHVASGGCGCKLGVGCNPVLTPDGIIVCQASIVCFDCGLALTGGGTRTLVYQYVRAQTKP
jgi:hypothetical protein